MPALIDSFASRAVTAWHGLGTVFDNDRKVTTAQMVDLAGLNWDVTLEELLTGDKIPTGSFATIRTNKDGSRYVLGVVGGRYTVVQNIDALQFADNILDGGGRWETAGALVDGATVFGSMAILDDIVLDPEGIADTIRNYLLVKTSHDGSSAIQVMETPVRVVCSNTLNMAIKGTKNSVKFRHTQSVEGKVLQARTALGLANDYWNAFAEEAKTLFETQINDVQFEKIVKALYPKPEADAAKAAITRWDNRFERLENILSSETSAGVRGTAWGALNALTEENQWFRQVRSNNTENALAAGGGFDDVTNRFRTDALLAVKAFA